MTNEFKEYLDNIPESSKENKIDLIAFGNALMEYNHGLIKKPEFAKRCGVSMPTLKKHFATWYALMLEAIASGELEWKAPEHKEAEIDSMELNGDSLKDIQG